MAGDFFFFNHLRVEMQIFPRAVASLSLFKAIIWERSFSRGCSSRTQGGWAAVSGPLWAGTEVPGPRKGKENAPGALSSGCAAFPRLGIGGFLNAREKTASSWQRGRARQEKQIQAEI